MEYSKNVLIFYNKKLLCTYNFNYYYNNMQIKGRPKKERNITVRPKCNCFSPKDIDPKIAEKIYISDDELECIKLKDTLWIWIIEWAKQMWISKSTFATTYNKAHKKIADALINGKIILFNCENF